MDENLVWFASFPKEFEKFRGKHVAILKKRIVASGDNPIEIYLKAKKKYPNQKIVLTFIPREEALILVLL